MFDLIHDWLVFHVLWVSRLRRDLLIVILYFGLSTDSFSHSVYVSPKAESCISGLSGWKTKGSFGQAANVISIKHSRISKTSKDCVFDLIHDWLVFPVLWVSRLRRDLLIVILYFGLPIDSFCKSSSSLFVVLRMSLEKESNAYKRVQRLGPLNRQMRWSCRGRVLSVPGLPGSQDSSLSETFLVFKNTNTN